MALVRLNGKNPPNEPLVCYASRTGTRRNVAALKAAGWRFLISPDNDLMPSPLAHCLDNGAWRAFQLGVPWDEAAFEKALDRRGPDADWVVLPDIVAGGRASLEMSMRWMNRCRSVCDLVLIAVQDGMTPDDLRPYVGANVGIFLGGSTAWKLETMQLWGDFCLEVGCWYHVARVNTAKRMKQAIAAHADSVDGSSASRFAKTLPLLDNARRQPDLLGRPLLVEQP